jgi:hypothetical protein
MFHLSLAVYNLVHNEELDVYASSRAITLRKSVTC